VNLSKIIHRYGVEGARQIEEKIDPQFQALKYLHSRVDRDAFAPLVVANALVSYQLSGKGENWWWEFAEWFSKNPADNIPEAYGLFLPKSRTNRRLVRIKVGRLEKINAFLQNFEPDVYYKNMNLLHSDLAQQLGSSPAAKTVVFAVKMFGYAMRIATGTFRPYPFEVPIPLDSRIKKLTERLTREDPLRFWNNVAKETGVPPLHIDSILWPVLSGDPEIAKKVVDVFGQKGRELVRTLAPYIAPQRRFQTF